MPNGYVSVFDTPTPSEQAAPSWSQWANQLDPFGSRYAPAYDVNENSPLDPSPYAAQTVPNTMWDYGNIYPDVGNWSPSYASNNDLWTPPSVQIGANVIANRIADDTNNHPSSWQGFGSGGAGNQGAVGDPATPKWSAVNGWDSQINQAVQTVYTSGLGGAKGVYVPPNVVKAIMQIESQGQMPTGLNGAGAGGLMQITSSTMGSAFYDMSKVASDPAYSIWAGVHELALRMKDAQAQLGADKATWGDVAMGYFSGHYVATGASDGNLTDQQYKDAFNSNWAELANASHDSLAQGGQADPNTPVFNSIWHNIDAPITQPFGMTDFAKQQLANGGGHSEYDYSKDYALDGKPIGHTGIDVGVAYGTNLYAPVAGTISIIGSADPNDPNSWFYTSQDGNGQDIHNTQGGELAVRMTNGDVYILGHMSQIVKANGQAYQIGDQVAPGDFVGYSGTNNGAHVHVEYRKYLGPPGTGTTTGFEVVDPSKAFQGNFSGTYQNTSGTPGVANAASPNNWQSFMTAVAQGKPLTGTTPAGGDSFHNWLLSQMPGQAPLVDTSAQVQNPTWYWAGGGTGAPTTTTSGTGTGFG